MKQSYQAPVAAVTVLSAADLLCFSVEQSGSGDEIVFDL